MPGEWLLDARLRVRYPKRGEVLGDFRLRIRPCEVYGLAGESGSGKSTAAMAVMGLLEAGARVEGTALFDGVDLLGLPERELRHRRGRDIALVPQSPLASLNPCLRLDAQFREAWRAHRKSDEGLQPAIQAAFQAVRLPVDEAFLRRFPRELSVGMAQRVLIAMAVLHRPRLLVADEATSALDVFTQREVLELFRTLNRESGAALLYITHDLLSAAAICDRLGVLHKGIIVEEGPVRAVLESPWHEYTKSLVGAMPAAWLWRERVPAPEPETATAPEAPRAGARRH